LRAESFKVCPAHRKNEKKRTSTIRLSKTKGIKSQPNNQILFFKSYGKPTQLIKICTTLRRQLSIQEKVLCRKLATKRLEDDGGKQSACSQVLVRQISQLANQGILDN